LRLSDFFWQRKKKKKKHMMHKIKRRSEISNGKRMLTFISAIFRCGFCRNILKKK